MQKIATMGAVLYAIVSGTIRAQEITIPPEPTCAKCTVRVDHVVSIMDSIGAGPSAISQDLAGRYYLVDRSDGRVRQYAPDGSFIRFFGRRGAGPGEYGGVRNILFRDGLVHLVDGLMQRITAWKSDGSYVGSTTVSIGMGPASWPAVMSKSGMIVNTSLMTRAGAGFTLHKVDDKGALVSQFDETRADARDTWALSRLLWLRPSGELWVGEPYGYKATLWSQALSERKLVVKRDGPWFPPFTGAGGPPSDGLFDLPPVSRLSAMWETEDGLLWMYTVVRSPDWKPGQPASSYNGKPIPFAELSERPRFNSMVEVIDLRTRRILARRDFIKGLGMAFGKGFFAALEERPNGEPVVSVSRITLSR